MDDCSREPQIRVAVSKIGNDLETLGKVISGLETRLETILTTTEPFGEKVGQPREVLVPLANELNDFHDRLLFLISLVETFNSRIEL